MLMKITAAAAALVAATALAGAASAQDQSNASGADQANPPAAAQTENAPAAASASAAVNAPASTDASVSSTGYNVGTPQTDPNTGAQIISNGPVPDTSANRARFGPPDSHAGRHTAPAAN